MLVCLKWMLYQEVNNYTKSIKEWEIKRLVHGTLVVVSMASCILLIELNRTQIVNHLNTPTGRLFILFLIFLLIYLKVISNPILPIFFSSKIYLRYSHHSANIIPNIIEKKRIQTNREEKMENIFLASGQFNINLCFKFIILLRKLFGRNSG